MQIIGYRYHRLNLFLFIALGLFLIIFGLKLLFQSSLSFNDFDRYSGPISRIEIVDNESFNMDDENRFLIQLKNCNNKIHIPNIQLKDKLKIGDSITVYAMHKSKISVSQEISNVYGLYFKNESLINLKETSRVNIWIGIILAFSGLILISGALIYYGYIKKGKFKFIDIDVFNLPNY